MNHKKWYVALFVLIGVVFVLAVLPNNTAEKAEAQGGLNLDQHCRQHGRDHAVNIDGTAYGWRCVDAQGQQFPMSIQDACNEQHGAGYTATFSNMNDPNSWTCVAQSQPPANPTAVPPVNPPADQVRHEGIDLARYCQDKGLGTIVLIGTHARDWRCQSGSTYSGLNLQEACLMQHGLSYVGLLSDDPYGWFCSNQPETLVDGPESPLPGQSQSFQPTVDDPGPAHGNQASDTRTSSGGCAIQSFTMTPQGPYVFGQHVTLEVRSTCGTVKFTVDGQDKAEIGSTNQTETWKTNETGVGTIHVCALGRGDGGWSNAAYICYDVYVGPQYRVDAYQPGSNSGGSSSSGDSSCPSSPSGLSVGQLAVVNSNSINVRSSAGLSYGTLRSISRGEVVSVISGPQCRDGYRWWEIGTNGWSGWSAEVGSNGDYLLLPNGAALTPDTGSGSNNQDTSDSGNSGSGNTSTSACPGAIASQIQFGMSGRVTYTDGSPTNLRDQPGGSVMMALPEGYEFVVVGGPSCQNSINWWRVRLPDDARTTGWVPEGGNGTYWIEPWIAASDDDGQENDAHQNYGITLYYQPWNFAYHFEVDQRTCYIVNAAEVVASEINRFQGVIDSMDWLEQQNFAFEYFRPNTGYLEEFRLYVENQLQTGARCQGLKYYIDSQHDDIDTSGLGNIVFGYFIERYPDVLDIAISDGVGHVAQGFNSETRWQFIDNADDHSQRDTGYRIAAMTNGRSVAANDVIEAAIYVGLY